MVTLNTLQNEGLSENQGLCIGYRTGSGHLKKRVERHFDDFDILALMVETATIASAVAAEVRKFIG